jgi:hypothetical protein
VSSVTQQNPVRIFVSHVWQTSEDYHRVFEYLESSHNFYYVNCSQPEQFPAGGPEAMRTSARQQIEAAEVVVIPAALWMREREWVNFHLKTAKELDKPVIVLEAFGVKQKMPTQLETLADEIVEWNERTLVDAIKRQARHEETTRWDVIEFKLD